MRVEKHGDSLVLRLPADIVEALCFKRRRARITD
jgi:antitoxin component of MazEF toxin-antitoxin module